MTVMVVVLVEHPNGFECLFSTAPYLPKLDYYVASLGVSMPHVPHMLVALKDVILIDADYPFQSLPNTFLPSAWR